MPPGMAALTVNHHHVGPLEAKITIDVGETKRPLSPQFPSPYPDCGFESDRSSLFMASLMLSRSRYVRWIPASPTREMAPRVWSSHEDNPPCLQGQRCQGCSNLPELEVGSNGVSMCRVQGPHPPTLCN